MRFSQALLIIGISLFLACQHEASVAIDQGESLPGRTFPTVSGTGLDGEEWTIPEDMGGRPAILIIGYVMPAQFDIDRWLVGLTQVETPVAIYEIPTIEGMVPRLVSGRIDEGMRGGIPEEDWGSVITVYGDADRISETLGRENLRNAQVTLIDDRGIIRWFHNRGFSAGMLLELDALARELADQ